MILLTFEIHKMCVSELKVYHVRRQEVGQEYDIRDVFITLLLVTGVSTTSKLKRIKTTPKVQKKRNYRDGNRNARSRQT